MRPRNFWLVVALACLAAYFWKGGGMGGQEVDVQEVDPVGKSPGDSASGPSAGLDPGQNLRHPAQSERENPVAVETIIEEPGDPEDMEEVVETAQEQQARYKAISEKRL